MHRYEQVGMRSLSYDVKGNVLSDGKNSYTYDVFNRQITLTGPGGNAEYVYDALGRRVAKIVDNIPTYVVYNASYQVLEERNATNALVARYTYGAGIDEVLTLERGGNTYTYHRDALGSITEVTNQSGALVERYAYDVYGTPQFFDSNGNSLTASAIGNPFLFTGRYYDPESGNYDYRARMYSPALGRFLQTDPLGYVDGLNLYAYVGNNPVNWVDPLGLQEYAGSLNGRFAADAAAVLAYVKFMLETGLTISSSALAGVGAGGLAFVLPVQAGDPVADANVHLLPLAFPMTTMDGRLWEPDIIIDPPTHDAALDQPVPFPAQPVNDGTLITVPGNCDPWIETIPATPQEPLILTASEGKRTLEDPLPRDSGGRTIVPDPQAIGPHTVLGTRTDPKISPAPYLQGITFDNEGNPLGKTDVTDHGRGDHVNPHWHPWNGTKFVGGSHPIPEALELF